MRKKTPERNPHTLIARRNIQTLCRRIAFLRFPVQLFKKLCLHDLIIRQESSVLKVNLIQAADDLLLIHIPALACKETAYLLRRFRCLRFLFRQFHIVQASLCRKACFKILRPAPQLTDPFFILRSLLQERPDALFVLSLFRHAGLETFRILFQPLHAFIQLLPNLLIVCQLELTQDRIVFLLLFLKLSSGAARLIPDLIHLTVKDLLPLSQLFYVSPDLQEKLMAGSELIEMLSVI